MIVFLLFTTEYIAENAVIIKMKQNIDIVIAMYCVKVSNFRFVICKKIPKLSSKIIEANIQRIKPYSRNLWILTTSLPPLLFLPKYLNNYIKIKYEFTNNNKVSVNKTENQDPAFMMKLDVISN